MDKWRVASRSRLWKTWVWRNVDLGSSNEKTISRCLACVNTVMPSSRRIPRVWAKLRMHTQGFESLPLPPVDSLDPQVEICAQTLLYRVEPRNQYSLQLNFS